MSIAISVENLVKYYGKNCVVKGISFHVNSGEIFGLLGANGAGKTTTLECIEGIKRYSDGKIQVNGSMGVQLQSSSLPNEIKVKEAMSFFSKWNKNDNEINYDEYRLKEFKDKQYRHLSTGQKRKLHLALAMLGDPDIVFLDEPTAGLDVESRSDLHDKIRQLKASGKSIILASHDMAEVESLCDRIGVLKAGNIVFMGSVDEFTTNKKKDINIHIKFSQAIEIGDLKKSVFIGNANDYQIFTTDNISDAMMEIISLSDDASILDIKIERASLEEAFIEIVKEEE